MGLWGFILLVIPVGYVVYSLGALFMEGLGPLIRGVSREEWDEMRAADRPYGY